MIATSVNILSNAINLVYQQSVKVNGIGGVRFYFSRKTTDSNLPIEISFVLYQGQLRAFCKQHQDVILQEVTIGERDCYTYRNDIIFFKEAILELISKQTNQEETSSVVETVNSIFGVDLSKIENITAFEFQKSMYVDNMSLSSSDNVAEGYLIMLADIATKSFITSIFVGKIKPLSRRQYADKVNEYSQNRILDDIVIQNLENSTFITNNSPFTAVVTKEAYQYKQYRIGKADAFFQREISTTNDLTIEAGQSIQVIHSVPQRENRYSLLSNPIQKIPGPVRKSNLNEMREALPYIKEMPFYFELKEISLPMSEVSSNDFVVVSSLFELFSEKDNFARAILDAEDEISGTSITGSLGIVSISNGNAVKDFIDNGRVSYFASNFRVTFNAKLRKIYSYLGEDQLNAVVDYTAAMKASRILAIESKVVYNDTISTPMQALAVEIGFFGDMREVIANNKTLVYVDEVSKGGLPCNTDRQEIVRQLLSGEFSGDTVVFNANDILNNPSKPVYYGKITATGDGELDDAYAAYQKNIVSNLSGFNMVNTQLQMTSAQFAAVAPLFNSDPTFSDPCREDLVYVVEENISELGLATNLEQTIQSIKKRAYSFRKPIELLAVMNIGISLDGAWYFCGEDFFTSENIENENYTTVISDEIKHFQGDSTSVKHPISDKKKFMDRALKGDEYKQKLHDVFRALAIGDIDTSLIYKHQGLRYIAEHLLDQNKRYFYDYEDIFKLKRKAVFKKEQDTITNKFVLPNILEQLINDQKDGCVGYIGDSDVHYFGKRREAHRRNYAKLRPNDKPDAAYEIGHTVSCMINTENIRNASSLFHSTGKDLFGVNFGDWTTIDTLSVQKTENVFYRGMIYGFQVSIHKNDIKVFSILYDYKTKMLTINNPQKLEIIDYALLLTSFDVLLHDYYDSLEGLHRVALGVYAYSGEESLRSQLSQKFLLSNQPPRRRSTTKIFGVSVGLFGRSLFVKQMEESATNIDGASIALILDSQSLKIYRDGIEASSIPVSYLESCSELAFFQDGFFVQIERGERFLPANYIANSLTRASITISSYKGTLSQTRGLSGRLVVVDFLEKRTIACSPDVDIEFLLDGKGLHMQQVSSKYRHPLELVHGIADILNENTTSVEQLGLSFTVSYDI